MNDFKRTMIKCIVSSIGVISALVPAAADHSQNNSNTKKLSNLNGWDIAQLLNETNVTEADRLTFARSASRSPSPDMRYAGLVVLTTVSSRHLTQNDAEVIVSLFSDEDIRIQDLAVAHAAAMKDESVFAEKFPRLTCKGDIGRACAIVASSNPDELLDAIYSASPVVRTVAVRRAAVLLTKGPEELEEADDAGQSKQTLLSVLYCALVDHDQVVRSAALWQILGMKLETMSDALSRSLLAASRDTREVILLEDVTEDTTWNKLKGTSWVNCDRWALVWLGKVCSREAPMLPPPAKIHLLPKLDQPQLLGSVAASAIVASRPDDVEAMTSIKRVSQRCGHAVLSDQLQRLFAP